MLSNAPVPRGLPFISATLQLAAGQNPANACPKDRTHSALDTAKAIATHAAYTGALRKIVRIAYIPSLCLYLYRNATPVNRRNQGPYVTRRPPAVRSEKFNRVNLSELIGQLPIPAASRRRRSPFDHLFTI